MVEERLAQLERSRVGKTVVFTNGVFDILHAGHVALLNAARALGDVLVVGVNTDESVRRLGKGSDRPINCLADRIAVLEALRTVDLVIPFAEDTPVEVIKKVRPNVHVKGGDYREDDLPEAVVVKAGGGRIVIVPRIGGLSTTGLIEKARRQ